MVSSIASSSFPVYSETDDERVIITKYEHFEHDDEGKIKKAITIYKDEQSGQPFEPEGDKYVRYTDKKSFRNETATDKQKFDRLAKEKARSAFAPRHPKG